MNDDLRNTSGFKFWHLLIYFLVFTIVFTIPLYIIDSILHPNELWAILLVLFVGVPLIIAHDLIGKIEKFLKK